MNNDQIIKGLKELNNEKKRNFIQKYDLILTLKDLDIKTQPIDSFIVLPHYKGKKIKICGIVEQDLADQAEKACELVIREKDLDTYSNDKKKIKALAQEYDFFVAQATLMPRIAAVFGRVFGPRNKMPNPKAGCVLPSNANIAAIKERLEKMVYVRAKTAPMIQCMIGTEDMEENKIVENILTVISAVTKLLPSESQNIKAVLLKKTMSKPVML